MKYYSFAPFHEYQGKALLIKRSDLSGAKQPLYANVQTSNLDHMMLNLDHMMLTQGVRGLGNFTLNHLYLITLLQIHSANGQ
jgi:hypothetical protein